MTRPRTRPTDYTPGAGGALRGIESALSSLPACPCPFSAAPGPTLRTTALAGTCGELAHPTQAGLECAAGHVFAGTPAEHQQAESALAAAQRRAPHGVAERAPVSERRAVTATYQARLASTAEKVATEIARRRAAGEPTKKLERQAAELAWYLDVEQRAAKRREELAGR